MLYRNLVKRAYQTTLEQREGVFNRVGVRVADATTAMGRQARARAWHNRAMDARGSEG